MGKKLNTIAINKKNCGKPAIDVMLRANTFTGPKDDLSFISDEAV